jgi:hypothetical protein
MLQLLRNSVFGIIIPRRIYYFRSIFHVGSFMNLECFISADVCFKHAKVVTGLQHAIEILGPQLRTQCKVSIPAEDDVIFELALLGMPWLSICNATNGTFSIAEDLLSPFMA